MKTTAREAGRRRSAEAATGRRERCGGVEKISAVAEDHRAHDVEPDSDVALAEALEAFAVGRVFVGGPGSLAAFTFAKARPPSTRAMKSALSLLCARTLKGLANDRGGC